jgi:hypothetical protein
MYFRALGLADTALLTGDRRRYPTTVCTVHRDAVPVAKAHPGADKRASAADPAKSGGRCLRCGDRHLPQRDSKLRPMAWFGCTKTDLLRIARTSLPASQKHGLPGSAS